MAVGKNKRTSKGKKGGKKKVTDVFTKKEWYDLKAPKMFLVRNFGKTLVTKTIGKKLATDGLKGRIYEVNLADLNNDEDQAHKKIKLCCDHIINKDCYTDFCGLSITRDKLCSLIRKGYTLIEGYTDVKTIDNYQLRMFCIAFTKKRPNQTKTTCYAQTSQIKKIRKKMVDIMNAEASKVLLKDLVKKFIPESIGKEVEKQCKKIYPLQNVLIRKVKILKRPKLDISKLMELHTDSKEDAGKNVKSLPESKEATNILSAELKH
ncbi:40S ribosomal protein S3A, putative [Plasmodium knowlesi strain H]|uniref:Small ribosomal subunit protein eS1 n=5 Tax=Plasmodium TaxID=5820 RepID=RS3A_PLAKH|nr:40S ribosomal protein S3A, putative [Plasmodium knowlesi strain H]XP_019914354.1 40S ribosomal protein S3a [Plasmodium coatneyi]B3L3W7.1 RecName: Full=Small ribosomal subunit protein eS1; AltName: Full=40S ribosomal protein S3a [Plasmodium knowlesi strain H]OTN65972.1 40S ribosomal protein S3a [Plasmodium knowlesi]ANQ07659.1 40S ribosomal protein S3a [Plasmodium coatneyi]CAA9987818.1 40S ribosomal protein S3A, putative [Plasmodium knowlesi strain H]SBO22383.1 40S ribosomal protein S3A, put|eukprot:XP_002258815.1 40s ribosomal protein s3a, putative [Plasmodium knowlesi strain H]